MLHRMTEQERIVVAARAIVLRKQGLTHVVIAQRLGVSVAYISNYLLNRGKRKNK